MAGPTTELMSSDLKDLGRKLEEQARDLRDLTVSQAETRTTVGNAKWILSLLLAGILALVGTSLYRAGELASQVKSLDVQIEKLETKVDKLEAKVDDRLTKLEAKVDKLEAKVDDRFDKLEAKVDATLKQVLDRLTVTAPAPSSAVKP